MSEAQSLERHLADEERVIWHRQRSMRTATSCAFERHHFRCGKRAGAG